MKIRTQVIGSMVFFGIALLLISASVITTNQHVDQLIKQEDLVKNIELKANELSYLSNDYLLFHEAPQLDRWELKYASLSDDLSNLTVDSADQQVLVNNIRDNQQRLRDVFHEIVATIENKSPDQQAAVDPTFIQVSWNRIGVQTQGIVFDASRLGQKLHAEKDQLMLFNYLLIIALLGTFGVFLLTSYYLIYRRTLKSISDLQAGTQIVGSGNLEHIIPGKKGDEFGELTGAFNRMTRELKSVTASKSDIEKEMSERMRAEDALRTSEEKYRSIVETATEGIWMADPDCRTTFVNKRMAEMIGYSPEEMIGKSAYDFMDDEAKAIGRRNLERRRQGLRDNFEQKYIRKDGSTLWAIVSATPLWDKNGRVIATMGMLTDITERKQAEILNNALNNINIAINSSLDLNRIMETATVEATKAIGYSRATVTLRDGDGWVLKYTFGGPQRPVGFRYSASEVKSISQMISQKKPIILNNTRNNPAANKEEAKKYDVGSSVIIPLVVNDDVIGLISFSDSATVKLSDAQVDFVNKFSTALALAISNAHLYDQVRHELEERAKAEDALRDVGNYLESLINYANAPIIVWDPAFRITRFNHAFEHLTGYCSDEVIGKGLSILFPDDSLEGSLAKIRRTLSERWESVEIPVLRKDGQIRIALWNSANIFGNDGQTLVATIAQGQDITERKRAENELLDAKMEAELYLDLMGHDINNIHQIAIGYLELACEALGVDEESRYLIEKPLETMQRAAKLIDNVRKLQQVQSGEIKDDVIDLDAALADVVREYRIVANVKITFDNGSGPHKVMANELIADVFSNIVGNAVKHANGNGPRIAISIDKVLDGSKTFYKVSVEDNGPGIPDDLKEKVFNRLQRGTTHARGVGLGLYLVKSLVESYHGRVWVEDRNAGDYTRGSRFVVMLPAIDN